MVLVVIFAYITSCSVLFIGSLHHVNLTCLFLSGLHCLSPLIALRVMLETKAESKARKTQDCPLQQRSPGHVPGTALSSQDAKNVQDTGSALYSLRDCR